MRGLGNTALAWLLSAAVAGMAVLPAEHVHHSPEPDHPAVIHRHLAPHHSETVSTLDHDDDDPQWLDDPYLGPRIVGFIPSLALTGEAPRTDACGPQIWHRLALGDAPSIHAPPRTPAGLRAPPSSLL